MQIRSKRTTKERKKKGNEGRGQEEGKERRKIKIMSWVEKGREEKERKGKKNHGKRKMTSKFKVSILNKYFEGSWIVDYRIVVIQQ